jgi:chemotaxis protein MotB
MARRRRRSEYHEEHMDETWLVPYSDILTLLLALFIVLFASSQIDQKKFEQIAQSFSSAFGAGSPAVFEGARVQPQISTQPSMDQIGDPSTKGQGYLQENAQLLEVKQSLDKYIQDNHMGGDLQTVLTGEGLMIRIKDTALYPSGSAELLPQSRRMGTAIAKMLVPLKQKVTISGHTDNVPINTAEFPSNWDLSSKRALNFMKFLLAQEKLEPERFSAIGYGEYRPLAPNNTGEGQQTNRRVEVLILRSYRAPDTANLVNP